MPQARTAAAVPALALALAVAGCSIPLDSGSNAGPRLQPPVQPQARPSARWSKQDITEAERREDVEACFAAARAAVQRDARMNRDMGAGRSDVAEAGQSTGALLDDMRRFGLETRRRELFDRCMAKRGYVRE